MSRFDLTMLWQGNAFLTALYSSGFLWHVQRFASLSAESGSLRLSLQISFLLATNAAYQNALVISGKLEEDPFFTLVVYVIS